MTTEPRTITDNLDELLAVLPDGLDQTIAPQDRADLIEIVLDLGRKPEARFTNHGVYLREEPITREDLDQVESRLGAFGDDNRAGIPATLHRISAIRNRRGAIVGLTLRVGRAVMGIVDILRDLIESGESLLLMGRPGLGKTTLLREMARVLADEVGKRVVIVDTSNEIAGDGDVPHPAIGRARRMQVARVEQQHDVMIEAVENHMPEVVVIDEIGRIEETLAARTIAERGVQLVATVHGNTLDNLLANPTMSDLVGGIQAVTLSDEEARRRRTQKTVLERKAPPTFNVVVEMIERDRVAVRRPVADVVDGLLRGQVAPPEIRWRDEEGNVQTEQPAPTPMSTQGRPGQRVERDFDMRGEYGGRSSGPGNRRGGQRDRRNAKQGNYALDEERFGNESTLRAGRYNFTGAKPRDAYERALLDRAEDAGPLALNPAVVGSLAGNGTARSIEAVVVEDDAEGDTENDDENYGVSSEEHETLEPRLLTDVPIDVSRVRRVYPFGVSRSRLSRAIKHLGLQLSVTRSWREADAVMMLTGAEGVAVDSSLLQEPRELGLPIIEVRGNTYAQILGRLNDLFGAQISEAQQSPRDIALREAQTAAQRVLAEAEPVELRPQSKPLRRLQHQLAERFHLRSYSVGREPNRRVRFLPSIRR